MSDETKATENLLREAWAGKVEVQPVDPTYERAVWHPPTPRGWRLQRRMDDGAQFRAPGGMIVIASAARHEGRVWVHLSASYVNGRLPPWPDLVMVRDAIVPGVECYQVAPPRARYVNLKSNVAHLWGCLDQPEGVLPPMEGMMEGVRTI